MADVTLRPSTVAVLGGVESRFPLRAAGIDVGSNAMRLVAGEFTATGSWKPLVSQRMAVRLGACVFGRDGGAIRGETLDAALAALTSFRRHMDELGVNVYRAAATSAVREAHNGAEFVQLVLDETGIQLEMITSGEEARLVWLAIGSRLSLADRRWVLVDLGGGSVEIALANGAVILWSESHAMGSVRLLAELGQTKGPRQFRRLAGEYIDTLVSRISIDPGGTAGLIATGGNMEELARLAGSSADQRGVSHLSTSDLSSTIDMLTSLSPQERIEQLGLRPDRADVILPAALVYERIAHLASADVLIVPNVGLKEGLLLDAVHDVAQHRDHVDQQERGVMAGAIALGQRYAFDEAHARQVARLARSLFDQLSEQHGLGDRDRRILLAAGILHDIGQYISYRRHHKHSYYLISNASLPDLSQSDTELVALVARYHRRAEPDAGHDEFATLSDPEQARVARLASLLRIADALDRQHRQLVVDLAATVEADVLRLDVSVRGDVALEEWAIEKKAQLITRVLNLKLDVRIRPVPERP